MLPKESKIRILENFYAIDYALFGKPVTKVETCCNETIKEYLSVKGALLSVMIEMHKLINHSPDIINEELSSKEIKKMAKQTAKISRENAANLVNTEKGKQDIKNELRENIENNEKNIEQIVEQKIREKSFALSLDNMLIARILEESVNYPNLNEVEGQILEDAYKVLRDSLVELAIFIDEYAEITN